MPITPQPPLLGAAFLSISNTTNAEFVKFTSASFGNPTTSTLENAVSKGFFNNYPRITAAMIRQNRPNSIATAQGHLDLTRAHISSTKPTFQ